MEHIYAEEGDVVKVGTHRYVVVEADGTSPYDAGGCFGGFGAQRIQPRRGYPITVKGRVHMVNEMYRSLSTADVQMVARNGRIVYRRAREE